MKLTPTAAGYVYSFEAMASPCEVIIDTASSDVALALGQTAEREARRIEAKYSRYKADSVLSKINSSAGRLMQVDPETAGLFGYADQCWKLSEGRFDITSGVLRRVWKFDGSDRIPTQQQIEAVLPLIGWGRVSWSGTAIELPAGMELDLGGIGKEYAVDMAVMRIAQAGSTPTLVNFGGDLRVTGARRNGDRWRIAIEAVAEGRDRDGVLEISDGALTTSGDTRRYLLKDGVRYSHILDPRTGWPACDPPRSVTVAAPTCLEAGISSTLAMLHGRNAETFLAEEGIMAWIAR